jgi:hypothetical protein
VGRVTTLEVATSAHSNGALFATLEWDSTNLSSWEFLPHEFGRGQERPRCTTIPTIETDVESHPKRRKLRGV